MSVASAGAVTGFVSFVCVRSDHQWGTADEGQLHARDGALAWCPDASLDAHAGHDWRACDRSPVAAAASVAAYLGAVESAAS
jgi:hypothetical protein